MATLKTVFREKLEGDSALTTILTGGIWDSSELPRERITVVNRPEIFEANGITLKPFAAITWRAAQPDAPLLPQTEVRMCEVYVYQHTRYDKIDAALLRLRNMFEAFRDRQLPVADDAAGAWVRWAGNLGERRDENLQYASMNRARFQIKISRR